MCAGYLTDADGPDPCEGVIKIAHVIPLYIVRMVKNHAKLEWLSCLQCCACCMWHGQP